MKTPPAHITAARAANTATLCKIWRVERVDGTVYTFTEHDRALTVDGEVYEPSSVISPSAIRTTGNLDVDDLEVQGALDSVLITEKDLLDGKWDGAAILLGEVDWTQPELGYDTQRWGWIGRVKTKGGVFIAELLGPTAKLQRGIGAIYQSQCRAQLGDAACGVNLEAMRASGTVSSVTSSRVFTTSGNAIPSGMDDAYWKFGTLTWTGGLNDGLSMEVYSYNGSSMELMLPMPSTVQAGDTFTIVPGCDHYLATCRDRYGNVLNFRGEPHVPVTDDVVRGPV